jgi:anthranilate/para-aminobenzoate synthase component I
LRELDPALDPESAFAALRRPAAPALLFDGRGGHDGAWACRLALEPRVIARIQGGADDPTRAMRPIDEVVARRRAAGGPGGTGVAVLVAYEAFAPRSASGEASWGVLGLEVDGVVVFPGGAAPLALGSKEVVDRAAESLARRRSPPDGSANLARTSGRPRTSLRREAYLRAVSRVKEHIARGDVYQANLTQRFDVSFDGDPWMLYRAIAAATPAPRSAYVEAPGLALASASPEIFVDVDRHGRAETRPIKGTRPRGATRDDDALAAAELLASEKDRAELVMIVDVLRNDLGRVALTGSVSVPELLSLRSYAAVHHLVARVVASVRGGVTPGELLAAVFPGGSITGAPKQRAIELLREIEPCPRGLYTGCLIWLDDDGSMASSILIRSAVVTGGRVQIGAGGGVTADSEPEAEWSEANAKARALTTLLGFDPEEAA